MRPGLGLHRLLRERILRDYELNYGRHLIKGWGERHLAACSSPRPRVLDLGCSAQATDLLNLARASRRPLDLLGIEAEAAAAARCRALGIEVWERDLERDPLPFEDQAVDLVVANQVLEHTKELFWILGEISRVLKPGGRLLIGVPNLASLHNRLLLLLGQQPTSIHVLGPHVRGFTGPGLTRFLEEGGWFRVLARAGSNFYPFPASLSRPLARLLPTMAAGLFLEVERTAAPGTFLDLLQTLRFETPWYRGPHPHGPA